MVWETTKLRKANPEFFGDGESNIDIVNINSRVNARIVRLDENSRTKTTIGPYGDSGMYRRKTVFQFNWANDLFFSFFLGLDNLFFFVIDSDGSGVDHLGRVLDQKLDLTHTMKFFDGTSSEGSSDLHTVRDNGWGDDLKKFFYKYIQNPTMVPPGKFRGLGSSGNKKKYVPCSLELP